MALPLALSDTQIFFLGLFGQFFVTLPTIIIMILTYLKTSSTHDAVNGQTHELIQAIKRDQRGQGSRCRRRGRESGARQGQRKQRRDQRGGQGGGFDAGEVIDSALTFLYYPS